MVTVLASRAGFRYVLPVTSADSWIVVVAVASAPSVVYASSIAFSGAPMPGN